MEYNPAERIVFNQIHFLDTSGIMCDWTGDYSDSQTRQSVLTTAIKRELKPNPLCEVRNWALPGQREWSRPKLLRD